MESALGHKTASRTAARYSELTKSYYRVSRRISEGLFISVCGLDGAGKTTQIRLLSGYLERKGYEVLVTKNPTDWFRTDPKMRSFLRERKEGLSVPVETVALFAAADRVAQYLNEILPALRTRKIVITDRYLYTGMAIMLARGLNDMEWLRILNRHVPYPDISFYIDTTPEAAMRRIIERGTPRVKAEENLAFLRTLRECFLDVLAGEKVVRVDGNNDIDTVHMNIVRAMDSFLRGRLGRRNRKSI